jgi:cyclophilin family peptidyl-prolyl cis-trans isomerase/HEAT repeat protein
MLGWLALLVFTGAAPPPAFPGEKPLFSSSAEPKAVRATRLELTRAPATEVLPLLAERSPEVRARALLALARLQDPSTLAAVVPLLADGDERVRAAAAFALGQGDVALAGTTGPHAETRTSAETALVSRLARERGRVARPSLFEALGVLSTGPGIPSLVAALGSPDAARAARALAVYGHRRGKEAPRDDATTAALVALLGSRDGETRLGATHALFRLNLPAPGALAARLATDADPHVRVYAARALASTPEGAVPLVAALRDRDWRVRVEATRSLAALPSPRGLAHGPDVDAMGSSAKEGLAALRASEGLAAAPLAHVVTVSCEALSKAPAAWARPHLAALAAALGQGPSPHPWQVDCAVARALDVLDGKPGRVLTCGPPGEPPFRRDARAVDVWSSLPAPAARAPLLAALAHDDARVRGKAADALASLEGQPDVTALLAAHLARETDPGVASTVADALQRSPSPAHVPLLHDALRRFLAAPDGDVDATPSLLQALQANLEPGPPDTRLLDRVVTDVTVASSRPSLLTRRAAEGFLLRHGRRTGPFSAVDPPLCPGAPSSLPARATVRTSRGDVVIRFYREEAPLTVTNFARLAAAGFYRGLTFHRVVPGFVVQGGDPRGDGNGGPGYAIPCEVSPRPYHRGVVGMALSGKDTGGSQFFITHTPQPHLDGRYTALGEVERGMEVVDALQQDDVILDVVLGGAR